MSYTAAHYAPLSAVEDRHFWFVNRNRVIGELVGQVTASLSEGFRVLEVGCGTGNVLRTLELACPRGHVLGMDALVEGLSFARGRSGCSLVVADAHRMPFSTRFHVVGLFDVIEHVEDDVGVLRDVGRALEDDGALLVTVPAYKQLWSDYDVQSGHHRRYSPVQLRSALQSAGFSVDYLTPFMGALYPMMWLRRRVDAFFRGRSGKPGGEDVDMEAELAVPTGMNGLLKGVLAAERPVISRRRRLPFGTSLLALARRAEE